MQIAKIKLIEVIKYAFSGGAFTLVSFMCFSVAFYFITPKARIFTQYLENNTLGDWFGRYFGSFSSFGLTMVFLVSAVAMAFTGYLCAIFAKSMFDAAVAVVDEEIEHNK
jgi:hypothetical protein